MRYMVLMPIMLTGACMATAPVTAPPPAEASCRNEALAAFIGRTATADLGAQMLAASGARALRWVSPGMAVTMDYRADRLTVSYDANMVIDRASCG